MANFVIKVTRMHCWTVGCWIQVLFLYCFVELVLNSGVCVGGGESMFYTLKCVPCWLLVKGIMLLTNWFTFSLEWIYAVVIESELFSCCRTLVRVFNIPSKLMQLRCAWRKASTLKFKPWLDAVSALTKTRIMVIKNQESHLNSYLHLTIHVRMLFLLCH